MAALWFSMIWVYRLNLVIFILHKLHSTQKNAPNPTAFAIIITLMAVIVAVVWAPKTLC